MLPGLFRSLGIQVQLAGVIRPGNRDIAASRPDWSGFHFNDGARCIRFEGGACDRLDAYSRLNSGGCVLRHATGSWARHAIFDDASNVLREALKTVDFNPDASVRSAALPWILDQARPRDSLTLWHWPVGVSTARIVFAFTRRWHLCRRRLAGVTRDGVLRLDQMMLESWREDLKSTWMGVK